MPNNTNTPKTQLPAVHHGAEATSELQRGLRCRCGAELRVIDIEPLPNGCQLHCPCGELILRYIPRTTFTDVVKR
jgi:hypothetical protein